MLDENKSTRQQQADKDTQFVTEIASSNDKVGYGRFRPSTYSIRYLSTHVSEVVLSCN